MLTFFTVPKPFIGHIDIIQRNAIQSWLRLAPACEVILLGNEPGTAELAALLQVRHLPDIERNEFGTPLLSSAFRVAAQTSTQPLLCYINADIILPRNFATQINRIRLPLFVLSGRRIDLDIKEAIDFADASSEDQLSTRVRREGIPHSMGGMDYFVFPRGQELEVLPPFAIGRPTWDGWFVHRALKRKVPVIDASESITVIHQNHDYQHVKQRRVNRWDGPEADYNRSLTGEIARSFSMLDATHRLTTTGLSRPRQRDHVARRVKRLPSFRPQVNRYLPSWKLQYLLCYLFPRL